MSGGKSVRLFLADGTPGGLLTAEIMNWTGSITAASRSDLPALLHRPEVARTGVYLLMGEDAETGGPMAYIGESDVVKNRLMQHAQPEPTGKDFWSRVVVLTSKDANLTKAHALYLESRIVALAKQADRAKLTNVQAPDPIALPEADRSDMEYFIEQAKIVLPVLGVNVLRSASTALMPQSPAAATPATTPLAAGTSPVFELVQKKDGVSARAQEVDGEFTVLKGSIARAGWTGVNSGYKSLRLQLERDGVISVADGRTVFAADHVFSAVSAAAAVVLGRSANGREMWKVAHTGTTYGEWQNTGLESAVPGLFE